MEYSTDVNSKELTFVEVEAENSKHKRKECISLDSFCFLIHFEKISSHGRPPEMACNCIYVSQSGAKAQFLLDKAMAHAIQKKRNPEI